MIQEEKVRILEEATEQLRIVMLNIASLLHQTKDDIKLNPNVEVTKTSFLLLMDKFQPIVNEFLEDEYIIKLDEK